MASADQGGAIDHAEQGASRVIIGREIVGVDNVRILPDCTAAQGTQHAQVKRLGFIAGKNHDTGLGQFISQTLGPIDAENADPMALPMLFNCQIGDHPFQAAKLK